MRNWFKTLHIDLFALSLGIMLTFAFAPYEIFPLAVLAPAGLLALLTHATPKRAFYLGFIFGLGMFGAGVYWVYISIHHFGDVPAIGAGIITAAMIALLSLYPAYACYLTNRFFPLRTNQPFNFAFAAIWILVEWFRGMLCTGFPWLFIGYSQTNSPLSGYAPILGVYGVSLAVLATSILVLATWMSYQQKQFKQVYSSLFAIMCIWIAGALFCHIPWTHTSGKPISVSLVQGNIPQSIKWSPEHIQLSFDRYQALTEPLWGKDKIIIWPEAAIPMPLQDASDFIQAMDDKATETGSHLLLGIPVQNEEGNGYYNSLVSVGSDKHAYLKRLLVPFGEYIPFQAYFAKAFSIMNIPMANSVPGRFEQKPMEIGGVKILPAICYEIAFPDIMRSTDKNIGMLLTVTNDAWFGKSTAQAQHLQMAAMRAIEMRRPALFVSNDGITAVLNTDGKIIAAAPQYQPFVLNATIQPTIGLTPWMKNGIDPLLAILICLLVASWRSARSRLATSEPVTIATSPL